MAGNDHAVMDSNMMKNLVSQPAIMKNELGLFASLKLWLTCKHAQSESTLQLKMRRHHPPPSERWFLTHSMLNTELTAGINKVRDIMAMAAGAAAGILGIVNLNGFLFYVAVHIVTSLALLFKVISMRWHATEIICENARRYKCRHAKLWSIIRVRRSILIWLHILWVAFHPSSCSAFQVCPRYRNFYRKFTSFNCWRWHLFQ